MENEEFTAEEKEEIEEMLKELEKNLKGIETDLRKKIEKRKEEKKALNGLMDLLIQVIPNDTMGLLIKTASKNNRKLNAIVMYGQDGLANKNEEAGKKTLKFMMEIEQLTDLFMKSNSIKETEEK